MAKYQALVPINHDGDNYQIGDELEISEKDAKQLIQVSAVTLLETDAAPAESTPMKGGGRKPAANKTAIAAADGQSGEGTQGSAGQQ